MNVVNLKTKLNQQIQPANEQLRKEFVTKKLAWIDRLLLDPSVSDLQFRVAVLISNKYLNFAKGYAWPKQDVMAADLGLKRRAVQNALDALVGAGHLGREVARGHGRNNRYWPIFDTENGDIRCAPRCTLTDDDDPQMCTVTTDDVHGDDKSDVHGHTHNNPFKDNPVKEPKRKKESHDLAVVDGGPIIISVAEENQPITSDFENWWHQYPKRVGKLKAEQAYSSAITKKKATPEELLTGAMRYSAERSGQDHKYTKHPATWLNAGSWADEPHVPTRGVNRADSAVAGMRGFLEDELYPPHIYRNVL